MKNSVFNKRIALNRFYGVGVDIDDNSSGYYHATINLNTLQTVPDFTASIQLRYTSSHEIRKLIRLLEEAADQIEFIDTHKENEINELGAI